MAISKQYTNELLWQAKDGEWDLRRHCQPNSERGRFIAISSYWPDYYGESKTGKTLCNHLECQELIFFVMAKKYLESVGFEVKRADDHGNGGPVVHNDSVVQ